MTIDVAQRWIDSRIGSLVSENILDPTKIFPLDYVRPVEGDYYIRAGVAGLGSKIAKYGDPDRSGLLVLQVFYRISRGEILTILSPIALQLEMQNESNFETGASSVNFLGTDPRDSTLNRLDLMLPYTVYG